MPLSKENFDKLFEIFKVECDEHIQKLNQGLLALEKETDQPLLIEEIFREAHSLKGAARMINLSISEKIAHHIENILVKIKKNQLRLSPEITNSVLRGLDTIALLVKKVSAGGKESDVDYTLPITLLMQVEQGFCVIDSPIKHIPAEPPKTSRLPETKQQIRETREPLSEIDINLFIEETNESHDQLVKNLLKIERRPNDLNTLKTAYNNIHALKGSARLIHHTEMGDLAFSIERVLSGVIDKKIAITPSVINTILEVTDIIKHFINLIEAGEEETLPKSYYTVTSEMDSLFTTSPKPAEPRLPEEEKIKPTDFFQNDTFSQQKSTVRISSEKLDMIMDQTNELVIMKLKSQEHLSTVQSIIDELSSTITSVKRKKKKNRAAYQNNSAKTVQSEGADLKDKNIERIVKTIETLENLRKSWFDDSRYFSNLIESLQYEVRKTRLLSINTITDIFPRMIRDLSASFNKKINFKMAGTELELDKHILEEIKAPLMHILRNSIDHGIESTDERRRVGKPAEGLIKIEVKTKGKNAVINIFDDGRGIDVNHVRETSIKAGFFNEDEISKISEKQILNQIFQPGFSTRDTITDISGRGMGLNVVKAKIEKLNGTIDIDTSPQKGTKMSLSLPTMLQTTQALKFSVNDNIFFLPMTNIDTIINVSGKDLFTFEGYYTINYRNSNIPYNKLSTILNMDDQSDFKTRRPAAVLHFGNTYIAVGVDRFLGEEEILVKELGHFFKRVKNVFGITIMSNGHIAPILNIQDLMQVVKAGGKSNPLPTEAESEKDIHELPVLVVDDSMMTRTMEKNIVESYGFDVITAVDGQDAFLKLREQDFSLVVTDIQMPNMDGLELTARIKKDERLKNIPVILLTALESVEDKKKGLISGADAYIIKSSFDHSNLMKTIKRLI